MEGQLGFGQWKVTSARKLNTILAHKELKLKMTVPEIWLVGSAGSGRSTLLAAATGTSGSSSSNAQRDGSKHPWTIRTKYYTAETVLCKQAADQRGAQFSGEAVVLVFDAAQEASFQAVQGWAEAHDTEEAGVRLVVATHVDQLLPASATSASQSTAAQPDSNSSTSQGLEPSRPSWLDAAIEWSTENCFEYVECCPTDPDLDKQLRLDGDVQGVARVVEALQAHMWPGLVRCSTSSSSSTQQQQQQSGAAAAAAGSQAASGEQASKEASQQAAEPTPGSNQPAEANGAGQETAGNGVKKSWAEQAVGADSEEDEEEALEEFEKLMADMSGEWNTGGASPLD